MRRDTKTFVFKIKNKIIKAPISFGAYKEMQREKLVVKRAENDPHFFQYILKYKYFLGTSITPYSRPFNNKTDEELIEKYFKKLFADKKKWINKKLKYLLRAEVFLNFIKKNVSEDYDFWKKFLNYSQMPQSSIHGDFHQDNILVRDNQLYFIDWSRFKNKASRYFDLIDYCLQSDSKSWMALWLDQANRGFDKKIYGIEVSAKQWLAYAVWKTADEIFILKLRSKFSQHKKEKYLNFVKKLMNYFT